MAADDEILGLYRFVRRELSGNAVVVTGARSNKDFDQTSPEKALYFNGGSPANAGRTVPAPNAIFSPGQRVLLQLNPVATKTLDTVGGTSADIRVGIWIKDHATGVGFPSMLTDASPELSTTNVASDGSKVAAIWNDAWEWLVPLGVTYQLYGETKIRSSTTA